MEEEQLINMRDAARYCGYNNTRRFLNQWVRKYKVPYESIGQYKYYYPSILDKGLLKAAETSAFKVYRQRLNLQGRRNMNGEKIMTLQEAAIYCGYKHKRYFMNQWVLKYNVPYEARGPRKYFLQSILDKWLVKVATETAKQVYGKNVMQG